MRAVVQRVMQASVSVGDELVSSIGRGLCVLIGVSRDDTPKDMEYIVRKILNLRVFDDDQEKRWAHSVKDKNYEILCVSQFTLYCVLKGNKPDFHQSMAAEQSQAFYEEFLQQMRKAYQPDKIKDGRFGAYMQVSIQNDGPVTIQLESPVQQQKNKQEKAKVARQQKWDKKAGANAAEEPTEDKMEQVTEQMSQTST
ncbi:D-aminoacyl-tRNA deacylase-like [Branchiostoma lanceolatum]|uniref:D-aminoacyl-tRNA deacylase-like n=1 Tax=Branchiostoma lanceolatum TaxID=7740 RepID=UPI003451FDFD